MARANNMDFNFNGNHYLMNRKPDYYVYLYTVSEHSQVVSRPPLISSMVLLGKKRDKYARAAGSTTADHDAEQCGLQRSHATLVGLPPICHGYS